jgi:hypothetical protein
MFFVFTSILIALVFFGAQLRVPTALAFPTLASFNSATPTINTCAVSGCHTGTISPSSAGITFPTGMTSYTPGGTAVPLNITVPGTTYGTWGFQLTARLASSTSSPAGFFTAGDNGTTQGSSNSSTFTVNWTPPPSGTTGNVNFYLTGVNTSDEHTSNIFSTATPMLMGPATGTAPTITSASSTTFTVGTAGTFTMTATGTPAPTRNETGALPAGVTFSTATGVLSGTPTVSGAFPITFAATNSTLPNASQSFTLTVNPAPIVNLAPKITSASSTTFTVGTAGTFMMTATGTPAPTLGETGALPAGVTFSAATGVLSGTPTVSGAFPITFAATNSTLPNASQSFTLTVNPAPTGTGTLASTPSSLSFNYQMGGRLPSSRTLSITSTGGSTSYTAKETDPWLSISPTSGGTPGSIRVSVNPAGMAAGSYGAQINITAQNGKTITVTVALIIAPSSGGGTSGGMFAQPYMSDTQSGTLAAAWVDNLGASPLSTTDPRNRGLVLAKSASASASAWAGAAIQNVTGMSLTELGFDFRASIQCSADSVHFLVVTTDTMPHTIGGCTSSPTTPPSSAPTGWMRLRFNPNQASPPITSPVQSISIVLDKGSTSTGSIAVIDNIEVNGVPVGKGTTSTSRDD